MKKTNENDNSKAAIRNLLLKVYSLKYFYIVCVALALIIGHFYNKYTYKVYEVSSAIGPVKDNKSSLLSSGDLFGGLGGYTPKKNVDDEINSLSSYTLVSTTVNSLNLEVGYFMERKSLLKQTSETYLNSPFLVTIDKSHNQPLYTDFHITLLNDSIFRLTVNEKEAMIYNYIDNLVINNGMPLRIDTICKFNRTISNKYFKFSITRNNEHFPSKIDPKETYFFTLYHLDALAKSYLTKLKIQPLSFSGSQIKVTFREENIDKAISFLNQYIDKYLEANLAKKNKQSISTMNFIDTQISEISDSLVLSESRLRNFKTANQVMDLSFQGQRSYEQLAQIETERNNLELQSRYYNYVINYFKTKQDMSGIAPPISANIPDPIMNQLISDLQSLNAERSNILANRNEKNLFLSQIENQIDMKKQAILENVNNNLNTLNITMNELNYRYDKLSREISNLPKTELNMVNIERKFNLNEAIYTYLLQKRSEAAITYASNYPDFEILEPARAITSKIVKPKSMKTYFVLLFIGLLIPTILLFVRELFNNNISTIYDVEHILERSVLGVIYTNKYKYESIVLNAPSSAIAESFRNLRSGIFSKLKSKKPKVLLTTSSQPQDGKSFVSFNIAASIASVGYKTIIIDCDLRRPTLHDKFEIENTKGVSTFITKRNTLKEVTNPTNVENLYFIAAGPLLPNPSELIDAGALDEMIKAVSDEYDFVIIDTSPVGLVADSLQLMKYASQILLIARNNYTRKDVLASALDILDSNNIENYDVVINDIDLKKSPYSSYTNYYIKDKHQ